MCSISVSTKLTIESHYILGALPRIGVKRSLGLGLESIGRVLVAHAQENYMLDMSKLVESYLHNILVFALNLDKAEEITEIVVPDLEGEQGIESIDALVIGIHAQLDECCKEYMAQDIKWRNMQANVRMIGQR